LLFAIVSNNSLVLFSEYNEDIRTKCITMICIILLIKIIFLLRFNRHFALIIFIYAKLIKCFNRPI